MHSCTIDLWLVAITLRPVALLNFEGKFSVKQIGNYNDNTHEYECEYDQYKLITQNTIEEMFVEKFLDV